MIDLNEYLPQMIAECSAVFGDRLLYLGLQGSYLRGEANEHSDIDIMAIIDHFSVADMDTYRIMLERIGHTEKACGFICGRDAGLRKYVSVDEMPRVLNGLGIAIVSTSKGLMTDKEARTLNVGGEVLCYIS